MIRVTLSNEGEMIPPEAIPRLFDKFWQGDASHATQGTGIGLSVVKKIVELHRGQVLVESTEARTAFTVLLPRQASV